MMMLVLCGDCNARGEECVCLNIGMGINRRVTCIYRRGAIFGALFWTSSKVEMVILMGNVTKSIFFFNKFTIHFNIPTISTFYLFIND